jgi:hypothetical protein
VFLNFKKKNYLLKSITEPLDNLAAQLLMGIGLPLQPSGQQQGDLNMKCLNKRI